MDTWRRERIALRGVLSSLRGRPTSGGLGERARALGPVLAGWVLPFALVVYLALKGGGYDIVVYSQVGLAAWWLILLGALVGVLPLARIHPAGWVALGFLTAFGAWTALGIGWSESAEQSVAEVGRVATYLGVFALALAVQGRDGLRRTVNAVAAAIALVGVLALLSRLHPEWFPVDRSARVLQVGIQRLNYPPQLLERPRGADRDGHPPHACRCGTGPHAHRPSARGCGGPGACAHSRLHPLSRWDRCRGRGLDRVPRPLPAPLTMLPTLLVVGGGSAILIAGAIQREALADGMHSPTALAQGDEMLAMTLLVCAGVALAQVAVGLAARYGVGPRPSGIPAHDSGASRRHGGRGPRGRPRRRRAGGAFRSMGGVQGAWRGATGLERLESAQGNFRYQVWQSTLDANATDPIIGIGPEPSKHGGRNTRRSTHSSATVIPCTSRRLRRLGSWGSRCSSA